MMGCHVVTRDEITKLQEFITLSDWSLQSIYGHFKIYGYIFKRQVSQTRAEKLLHVSL